MPPRNNSFAADQACSGSASLLFCHAAQCRFRASGYLALRDVCCTITDDVVCLQGMVPSHYLKQVAQEIAFRLDGVRHVVNRIEVLTATSQSRPAGRP